MKLKALVLTVMSVIMAVCLAPVFLGCAKEKMPVEATRQLVIPPEYEPETVLPHFGGNQCDECVFVAGGETENCRIIQRFIEAEALEEDFIKGYAREYSIYTLKSGEEIGVYHPLLLMLILKYETTKAAGEAFTAFSEIGDLEDLIFDGVEIKGIESEHDYLVPTYMLQSNKFVIYLDGDLEACRDAISRIIELYSVPISKD